MLASGASFNPGLTVAVAKDRAIEPLMHTGDKFVLNILKEGMNLRRHFLKSLLQEKTVCWFGDYCS